jgi:hypothetical protein
MGLKDIARLYCSSKYQKKFVNFGTAGGGTPQSYQASPLGYSAGLLLAMWNKRFALTAGHSLWIML